MREVKLHAFSFVNFMVWLIALLVSLGFRHVMEQLDQIIRLLEGMQ